MYTKPYPSSTVKSEEYTKTKEYPSTYTTSKAYPETYTSKSYSVVTKMYTETKSSCMPSSSCTTKTKGW